MLIYKIFRQDEWALLRAAGATSGAPVDRQDGYIHFSTAAQLPETLAKHFAGQDDLILLACKSDRFGDDLRWEVSRGGAEFPHLYRQLRLEDIVWQRSVTLGADGRHVTGKLE